ncbi:protein translocase subunit SecF [Pseudoramibacter porci]|uniref:Protein-export membrane protein SecF n=1 Tax=Pseudoramibacter porci TaxID=2606631 RepID=A0A7X2TAC5_9FIRM|nr:protein translocase subunit SecF [Pseudoramibacter porci]MSS20302.1 protein translocase subunit SecF [Pseudoramibacter porci]
MNFEKKLPIIEKTKIWLSISLILIAVAVGSILIRGLNYGIDFVGGTIITIDLHQTFDTKDIKSITDAYDKSADITYSGNQKHEVVISTKESLSNSQQKKLFASFKKKYNLKNKDLVSVDNITASVGAETTRNTIIASIVAVVLMLVYVTIRFEFYFGLSAVLALVHDIVIVIGVYALFQIQVNSPFIAAILTILGYSINDTIVVFDRIRENEGLIGMSNEQELTHLVDVSVTQTMRRSINTVATTLVAIIALYIFAVDAIRDFALPLIVGIACGCYSSIFVASPLWVIFQKKSSKSKFNAKIQRNSRRGQRNRRKAEKIEV